MPASSNPADCSHPNSTWADRDGGYPIRQMQQTETGLKNTMGTAKKRVRLCNTCSWELESKLEYSYS